MYKKENFLPQSPDGYTVQYGECVAYDNTNPLSRTYLNSNIDTCLSLCKNDDNCSGYSWDGTKCKIFNPTIGGTKAVVSPSTDGFIVNKGNGINGTICYIKNNIPETMPNYDIKLNTNYAYGPPYSYAYTNFKYCKNSCDIDPSCNAFRYDNKGVCVLFNPVIPSTTDRNWTSVNSELRGSPINDNFYNTFIKSNWTVPTTSSVNPVIDPTFTLLGNTNNYTTKKGYGTITFNSTTQPTRLSWTGKTLNDCFTSCNNDSMCSGYAYNSSTKECLEYNHTFSNIPAADPNYYKLVMSVANDLNWVTYIKPRPIPNGFILKEGGICRTSNNKEVPYTKGNSSYSTCANMCNNDSLCAGYSYGDNGDCILHDPSIPNIIPTNGDITGTPLTQISMVDFEYNCYIKTNNQRNNINESSSNGQSIFDKYKIIIGISIAIIIIIIIIIGGIVFIKRKKFKEVDITSIE